jgi:putative flippase GtrA
VIDYLRSFLTREALRQFMKMTGIGLFNTFVDFGLLNVFFSVLDWGELTSVTVAFVIATFSAYILNRRFTFGLAATVRFKETVGFLIVNGIALGITDLLVWIASERLDGLTQLELNVVKLITTGIILIPKFAGYRDLVFKSAMRERDTDE